MPRKRPTETPQLPACITEYHRIKRMHYASDSRLREQAIEYILDRAMQDHRLQDIAKDVRMSTPTLHRTLYTHAEEQWKEVQVARMQARYEQAVLDLEQAPDAVEISRSRELIKALQWQLERLHRRLYGTDAPSNSTGRITINLNMGATDAAPITDVTDDDVV